MALILIIDDDESLLQLMQRALARAGFDVAAAADGRDGLAQFRARRPDLVVTDLKMPFQDGFDTLREIRVAAPAAKVIAIAGHYRESDECLKRARALGADDVLEKPFMPADLVGKVSRCLGA
jgi:two-component system, chemotaxis family, chemotaxis protein CheY